MASITGIDPPPLRDQDYVDKINGSLNAIDAHDHTSGKGVQIPTGGIADGAVTNAKLAAGTIDLTSKVTGVLPVANGGTGSGTQNFVDLSTTQVVAGEKTFSGSISLDHDFRLFADTDTSTGNVTALDASGKSFIRLTGAAPVIQGILGGSNGKVLVLANVSGADFNIDDESGSASAANRIRTGTSTSFKLKNNAIAVVAYDATSSRWRLLGGGGGGAFVQSDFTGTSVVLTADTAQRFRYTGGSAQTATFSTGSAVDGAEVEIMGTSDTNTVTIDPSGSVLINGQWVGSRGSILRLRWDSGLTAMVEVTRNGL